ncbi:MAG: RNA polymerase subunit sigma-70, partial [bacterium]|nr:RNA polymerase subunit sigma-70 [bacterium]
MTARTDTSEDPRGSTSHEVTELLEKARSGSAEALEDLVVSVYRELRRTAQSMIGLESPDLTLVATDVVHEAFLRLFGGQDISWENRRHFFGSAATAMRRVLIDHARKARAGSRIPKNDLVPLDAASS